MVDEGPLIALVGSAIPRDDDGNDAVDPDKAREARIREACKALGRALADARCRLVVYSSDRYFIEADVIAGYAEVAKTQHCIQFVRPESDDKNFAEQDHDRTRLLFDVRRHDSQDWEVSFYRSLGEVDGVIFVSGGSSTLIAGHVAMTLGRPIAPISAFGGTARKLRNHLVRVQSNLSQSELQALSEFDSDDAAVTIAAGLKRRCEEVAAARQKRDEEMQRLEATERQLALLQDAARLERHVRWGMMGFGVASLALLALGRDVDPSGSAAIVVFMALLAAGGGLGACLRLTRVPSAGNPSTAMVVGAIAGAVCSLSYMLPHWMSNPNNSFELGGVPSSRLWLLMTWLIALGGGLAADAVIDSLRRGGEKTAQELKPPPAPGAAPAAAGVAPARAAQDGRKRSAVRAKKGG